MAGSKTSTMPLETSTVILWMGLAFAEPTAPAPPPEAELLEFLGSFETKTGQWPDLNEVLAKRQAIKVTTPPISPPQKSPPKNEGEPEG